MSHFAGTDNGPQGPPGSVRPLQPSPRSLTPPAGHSRHMNHRTLAVWLGIMSQILSLAPGALPFPPLSSWLAAVPLPARPSCPRCHQSGPSQAPGCHRPQSLAQVPRLERSPSSLPCERFFNLIFVLAVLGLCCCVGFSSCSGWGLLSSCGTQASHCSVLSCSARALGP